VIIWLEESFRGCDEQRKAIVWDFYVGKSNKHNLSVQVGQIDMQYLDSRITHSRTLCSCQRSILQGIWQVEYWLL